MSRGVALLLVLVVAVSSCILTTRATIASENSWITRPPLPDPKSGLGVAVVNGKIYAIGSDGTNEEYDPAALTWTTKQPVPTPRSAFGIAVYQNKIYVIGGYIGFDMVTGLPILGSVNEVYDPLTDSWESKETMPTNRSQLNANVANGKIYLIGGRTGGQYSTVNLNEAYDPETDSWTVEAPVPYPVVLYASAVVDDKIYVMGGQDEFSDSMNLDLVQIYEPSTDTWSFGSPMPTVVWQAAAAATTGVWAPKRIYVIGGLPDHSLYGTDINQAYNPEDNSWTLATSMPTPRLNLGVAVVNDTLYALGGASFANVQATVYEANELYIPLGYEGPLPPHWSPSPSPSPSPTTSPTPSPSEQTIETPEPQPNPFPTTTVAAASVAVVAVVSISLLIYFKKRKHQTKKRAQSFVVAICQSHRIK